jgi:hypothetical protein
LRSGQLNVSDSQRNDLDGMGFAWKLESVISWETKLAALQDYKDKNGDVLVPWRYVHESSGIKLGNWVYDLRYLRIKLGNLQRNDLDRMGFVWKVKLISWETKLAALQNYKEHNGDILVPHRYVDVASGIKLGDWVHNLRQGRVNLSDSQRYDLEKMGFVWNVSKVLSWEAKLAALQNYKENNGDALVPSGYFDMASGFKLGRWVDNVRQRHNLTDSQQSDLDGLGFVWGAKRGPMPKPLVRNMACVDAAAATMTTNVARKKKGATAV